MTKKTDSIQPRRAKPAVKAKAIGLTTVDLDKLRQSGNATVRELLRLLDQSTDLNKSLTNKLKRLSAHDELTRVFNRRHFDAELDKSFVRRRRTREDFALAIIEVDDFRAYIAASGRQRGEVALKTVATSLKKIVRRQTDVLARIGACEFALLMSATDGANATLFAEKLCNAVWSLFLSNEKSRHGTITVSVGVSDTRNAPDRDALIVQAYGALKVAHKAGRNTVKHSHRE